LKKDSGFQAFFNICGQLNDALRAGKRSGQIPDEPQQIDRRAKSRGGLDCPMKRDEMCWIVYGAAKFGHE